MHACQVIGSTAFDGFTYRPFWQDVLGTSYGWTRTLISTVGLIWITAMAAGAFLLVVRVAERGQREEDRDRRLTQARTSDPVTRQRRQLELALAKAATSVTAMIEAYSEQLITIDELRTRMPHLRAREASLRSQLEVAESVARSGTYAE